MNHSDLCKLALSWLKRPNSRKGHGCAVALSECRTGWDGEIPDAIGFRTTAPQSGSVLIEVKTSRADFLADKDKPHRQSGGVGDWRYYMAPEGVLQLSDMPERWGLIEVNKRGHIKVRSGLAQYYGDWRGFDDKAEAWRFNNVDREREQFLLVRVLANTDPQKTLDYTRAIANNHAVAIRRIEEIAVELGLPKEASISCIKSSIRMMQMGIGINEQK